MKQQLLLLVLITTFLSDLSARSDRQVSGQQVVAVEKVENNTRQSSKLSRRLDRIEKKLHKKSERLRKTSKSSGDFNLGFVGLIVLLVGGLFVLLGLAIPYAGILFLLIGGIIGIVGLFLMMLLGGFNVDVD